MLCLIHKNSLGQGEERQNHQTENDLCPFLSVLASGAHLLLWDQDRYGTCFRDWASLCLPLPILLLKLQVRGHSLQKALPRPPNPPQGDAIWAHLGAQHINREWYLWCGNGLFFIQRTAVEMIHAVPQTFPFDLFFFSFKTIQLMSRPLYSTRFPFTMLIKFSFHFKFIDYFSLHAHCAKLQDSGEMFTILM